MECEGSMESEGTAVSPKPLEQDTIKGKTPFPFTALLAVLVPTNIAVGWRKTSCPVGDWAVG